VNHHASYVGQRSSSTNFIVFTHEQTHTRIICYLDHWSSHLWSWWLQ